MILARSAQKISTVLGLSQLSEMQVSCLTSSFISMRNTLLKLKPCAPFAGKMHFGLYSPAPIGRNRRALKLSRENGEWFFFTKERVNMGVCH